MALPTPYPNDFCTAGIGPDPRHPENDWAEVAPGRWERTDQWGNVWARVSPTTSGEVVRGALEDWGHLDEVEMPDFNLPERYEQARKTFAAHPDQFKMGFIPGFPFSIARYMRRMENFLADVAGEPDTVVRLLEKVEGQVHHMIRRMAQAGAEGIFFCEDWGTQDRLLVSPAAFRRIFKPGFVRLCRCAHERGLFVFMHSCGCVYEAMNDLIAAGIDLFQFDQPALYGVERLADEFGGRVSFQCPVDIQRTLQTRDPVLIEKDARKMVELLGGKGGGFVAGYYWSNEGIDMDPAVQDVACQAFVKWGAPRLWQELKKSLPVVRIGD